jgi:hypothetical protein
VDTGERGCNRTRCCLRSNTVIPLVACGCRRTVLTFPVNTSSTFSSTDSLFADIAYKSSIENETVSFTLVILCVCSLPHSLTPSLTYTSSTIVYSVGALVHLTRYFSLLDSSSHTTPRTLPQISAGHDTSRQQVARDRGVGVKVYRGGWESELIEGSNSDGTSTHTANNNQKEKERLRKSHTAQRQYSLINALIILQLLIAY